MTRKHRVIDRLRRRFPEARWTYDREHHRWLSTAGWHVQPYSALASRYEGDDSFETQYHRSDTHERLHF